MKTQLNILRNYFLISFCIIAFAKNTYAQNYSIPETVDYINKLLDSETLLEFSNNKFILKRNEWVDYRTKEARRWNQFGEIHLSNISKVSIGEPSSWSGQKGCYTCVTFYCKYGDDCAKSYYATGKYASTSDLRWDLGNNNDAEKIANALRYIIEKAEKSTVNNDPFSKYSKETKDYSKININDLYVGMSKNLVFSTLNTKPVVESIESGYEVYKVKRNMDQYFLYFVNNKLTRVDKGVSIYDAIIIIK